VISSCRIPLGRIQRLTGTAAIALCAFTSVASAQTATAPALKAAFLYNFAKFTEWPADALPQGEPLVMCVINDRAVGEMLTDLTKGRSIDGHAVVVSTMKLDSPALAACRVLFTSGLDAARSGVLLESVGGKPVLTVSDHDKFAQLGGVANFFVENGNMRFAINLDAAQRAGVRLSSKLLNLAKIVKDDRNVLRR
jgi:uncharacterized protein DUF4154